MRDLLIPVRKIRIGDGRFTWPKKVVFATANTDNLLPLGQLAVTLKKEAGLSSRTVLNALGPCTVRIRRDHRIRNAEGYRISVKKNGINVSAGTSAGAYYAVQTLREMLRSSGKEIAVCEISDEPDFARRGVYLDCARGKVPTVKTIKALVENLASWKLNELQLYIENTFTFRQHPKIGRGFSPFTPADMLEIQDHCKLHHIRLVPSLTSLGHFERILSLPEYTHLGELPGSRGLPGGTTLCPGDPGSIKLVEEMYAEFVPLFESLDFNVCCDEPWELGNGRSRKRAEKIGAGRVYLDFIKKLHRLCEKHNRRMNMWSDIVLKYPELVKQLPEDIVVLNWDYHPDGSRIPQTKKFAAAGLEFMVCPGTNDWQSHGTELQNAIDNVSVFAKQGRRHGAEGLLNTEWGDEGHRNTLGVNMHGFAHGAAHSWNGRSVDDGSFTETFCRLFFGQRDSRLATAMKMVGNTGTLVGRGVPYHSLSEPMSPQRSLYKGVARNSPAWTAPDGRGDYIGAAELEGCEKAIAALDNPLNWRSLEKGMNEFTALTLRDIILAARMDRLACRRIIAARAIRSGKKLPSRQVRSIAAEFRSVIRDFEENWLRRNRPSRLCDNMKIFENAVREMDEM